VISRLSLKPATKAMTLLRKMTQTPRQHAACGFQAFGSAWVKLATEGAHAWQGLITAQDARIVNGGMWPARMELTRLLESRIKF